jgi:hypothetical protein
VLDVAAFEHAVQADVAVEGELLAVVFADRAVGAADKQVGLDADLAELGDGLLRGLRLELAGGRDPLSPSAGSSCRSASSTPRSSRGARRKIVSSK